MEKISQKDRDILRNLANKKLEIAQSERNQRNLKDWMLHNTFRGERPMIHIEIGGFCHELIPQRLRCEGPLARMIEEQLYGSMVNYEVIGDDYPVTGDFKVNWRVSHVPFGLTVEKRHVSDEAGHQALGHIFEHPIKDLEDDYHKFGPTVNSIDKEGTLAYAAAAADLFGDILPVQTIHGALYICPTQYLVHLMGMETMLISMYDCPELFHALMRRYADDVIAYFRLLESENVLTPTVGAEFLGNGTWCFTDELPSSGPLTSKDLWGFMDSQETVGVSPEMFAEMIFPYYKMIADQYGLLSYGCCEPAHPHWEHSLSRFENLRKISISPWCDEEYMGAQLKGRKTVFYRKPSSNYLGVDETLDEEAFRLHIRKTLRAAQGCTLEIAQRDIYTIHHNEAKVRRYVDIIRDEISRHW